MVGRGRQLFVCRRAAASAAPGFRTGAAAATCVATAAGHLTSAATFGLLAADTSAAALDMLNAAAVFDLHASVVAIFIAAAAFGLSAITIGTLGLPAVLTVSGLF